MYNYGMEKKENEKHHQRKQKLVFLLKKSLQMFFRLIKDILYIDFSHERHTVNVAYYSLTLDKTKFA